MQICVGRMLQESTIFFAVSYEVIMVIAFTNCSAALGTAVCGFFPSDGGTRR